MAASEAWLEVTDDLRTSLSSLGLPPLMTEPLLSLLSGDARPKSARTIFSAVFESNVERESCTEDGSVKLAGANIGGGNDMRKSRLERSRESASFSDFERY